MLTGVLHERPLSVVLNQMNTRLAVLLVASILGLGACTTLRSSPATTPPIVEPPATTTATATTTMPTTTTTLDIRITEIQAIFQDLEVRRLQAIMDQDEEAFRSVFANDEYATRSVGGMDLVTVVDPSAAIFTVLRVFVDDPSCIAVEGQKDSSQAIDGVNLSNPTDYVVQATSDGGWGMSWIGSGWRCEVPHPFSD
jgi:hypothetical protein